jgi:hypothetical protein
MNEINTIDNEQQSLPIELSYLFAQLAPQDVEQFYQSYRLWSLQHDIAAIQGQISELQQRIEQNAQSMQSVQPSPIALSALAQLQAYGISDIDLLERMLERGDSWLDHTVQLLVRCEELNVIRSDYTQWCENALEGAYDWITSMDQATAEPAASEPFDENIEITLIQKLMSEDSSEPGLLTIKADSTNIADQSTLLPANNTNQSTVSTTSNADPSTVSPPSSTNPSLVPSPSSAGTDLSCPPCPQGSQQHPHEHAQSLSTESDIIAEPDSSYGTTEAINLEDLKVPVTTHEEDSDANPSSTLSDQSIDEIHLTNVSSDLHNTTTETTENATNKQRMDTIYSFRNSPLNTSRNSDIATESPITVDSSISEATDPTANHTEQAPQLENDREEQTATTATITATNTVTARTVKSSEYRAEQPEQTTDHTTTQVHLQEDDLALPPVTTAHKPGISWSDEPTVTSQTQHSRQTLQTSITHHEPTISWSESTELPIVPPKEQRSLLARLFRHSRNEPSKQ